MFQSDVALVGGVFDSDAVPPDLLSDLESPDLESPDFGSPDFGSLADLSALAAFL